jgi:hypothetical protein
MNCIEYCENRAKFDLGNCLDDEMVLMANDIYDFEEKVRDLRIERLQFATISLTRGGEPKLIFIDEDGFKQNLNCEGEINANIARIKAKFVQLAPLFEDVQSKLNNFNKPTLRQLRIFVNDAQNKIFMLDSQLKDELHFRLTSTRSRRMNIDEVLNDPTFNDHKKAVEMQIAQLKEEVEIAKKYIEIIDGVLRR